MGLRDEINKAILSHGAWKRRLADYINGKRGDFDPEKAGTDDNCEFGKWLYGDTISEVEKNSEYYKKIRDLHEEFHKTVKEVTKLVLAGKTDEANNMISFNGSYTAISVKLVLLLTEWEKSVI